jgi:hypothetical protein
LCECGEEDRSSIYYLYVLAKRMILMLKRATNLIRKRLKGNDKNISRLRHLLPNEYINAFDPLNLKDQEIFIRNLLFPISFIKLKIDDVYWQEVNDIFMTDLFYRSDGSIDWHITNGPIYKLLKIYQEKGWDYVERIFPSSKYFEVKKRVQGPRFSKNSQLNALKSLIGTYENIKAGGYLFGRFSDCYISVLEKPFIVSRYGEKRSWKPFTVCGGHHRASILAALGYTNFRAVLLKDLLDKDDIKYGISNSYVDKYKVDV